MNSMSSAGINPFGLILFDALCFDVRFAMCDLKHETMLIYVYWNQSWKPSTSPTPQTTYCKYAFFPVPSRRCSMSSMWSNPQQLKQRLKKERLQYSQLLMLSRMFSKPVWNLRQSSVSFSAVPTKPSQVCCCFEIRLTLKHNLKFVIYKYIWNQGSLSP